MCGPAKRNALGLSVGVMRRGGRWAAEPLVTTAEGAGDSGGAWLHLRNSVLSRSALSMVVAHGSFNPLAILRFSGMTKRSQ